VEKGYMYSRIEGKVGEEKRRIWMWMVWKEGAGVLERVMVMRVFDFVGSWRLLWRLVGNEVDEVRVAESE
jgi:hypothetical protein